MGDDEEELEDTRPTVPAPIDGPPEFVRAVEIQRAYWMHDPEEHRELERRGLERLTWPERLRLHHLTCLEHLAAAGAARAATAEKCRITTRRLAAADSPYRPRPAMIWQRHRSADPRDLTPPDLVGDFLNASITHLGCLEIYRVDASRAPVAIDFIAFDDLAGVMFGRPGMIRAANVLRFDAGEPEDVAVPLLYSSTWAIGREQERAGVLTRFVADLDGGVGAEIGASAIGVGHQDFFVRDRDGGRHLFGLGSVTQVMFPIEPSDPRFDAKARAMGVNPDELRQEIGARRSADRR